jgi:UDP-2,3-diacylglucosamine pyrophosphatase LpxH
MLVHFDLISDLHVETWGHFDWTGQPTSPYCIVAGDVAKDHAIVVDTLEHLGEVYKGVFYIDGNDEHKNSMSHIGQSYRELSQLVSQIPNVVYLQDNVVVVNGVGIVATNGWWSGDFDPCLDFDQSVDYVERTAMISRGEALAITDMAYNDAAYMVNTVSKLQRHRDVKAIIMVSHTVPAPWIIEHDPQLVDSLRFNVMGNSNLRMALDEDSERKIQAWCFGHYHRPVDRFQDGIRYVNNCRGRGDTEYQQSAYYPKRITVEF